MSSKTSPEGTDDRPPLLSVRTALILLLAVLAGGLVTGLMITAGNPAAEAVLGGLGGLAAVLIASNKIIG